MTRIFVALSSTQLLSLVHILRNAPRQDTVDILLWCSYENALQNRKTMLEIMKSYKFASAFEIAGFKMSQARSSGPLLWPIESLLRHRDDAKTIRRWLAPVREDDVTEIWTDEPIHFPMRFLHGLFPKAVHVKFPHAFDQENEGTSAYRRRMIQRAEKEATSARMLFWRAVRLTSGVHYNLRYGFDFDRAYTFDVPSPWSRQSIDVSGLIKGEALNDTYKALPLTLREEIETKIRAASPIREQPWALVLLFGLDHRSREIYKESILRVYREHHEELSGLQLVVKPHPLNRSDHPEVLVRELADSLGRTVTLFDSTMNLDIMWSVIPATLVMAGPCGALPIIRRLGTARGIVLREIWDHVTSSLPEEEGTYLAMIRGSEIW